MPGIQISLKHMLPHIAEADLVAMAQGAAVEVNQSGPLVTCVMPTDAAKRRGKALVSIRQFEQQKYPRKELVIVNTSKISLFGEAEPPPSNIRELMVDPAPLGTLRNVGIDAAQGQYIKQWDDDDLYDPQLLTYMMAHRAPGTAVMLKAQVRANLIKGTAYRHVDEGGIPNTILFHKGEARYGRDVDDGDDIAFVLANWTENSLVIDNEAFPLSTYSVALYHGGNVTPMEGFMGDYADPKHDGRWYLNHHLVGNLKSRLAAIGFTTTATPLAPQPVSAE